MNAERKRRGQTPQFDAPDIPPEEWCGARKQFESGQTMLEIANARGCDPRTVKACILRNCDQLDGQSTPRVIDAHIPTILSLLHSGIFQDTPSLRSLARQLQAQLRIATGYCGNEKSLRNYLQTLSDEHLPRACRKQENQTELEDGKC